MLNSSQILTILILQIFIGSIERHHLMFLMMAILVHASYAKWLFITHAVKCRRIVMLQASLQRLGVEDGGLNIDRAFHLFLEPIKQSVQGWYLEAF